MKNRLFYLSLSGVMLALLIICSQLTVPFFMSPLTLQTLAVGLIATLLPLNFALETILVYLLMGALGLPVFANFRGGISVFLSSTGGYLIGFICYVVACDLLLKQKSFSNILLANLVGATIQLLLGSLWLMIVSNLTLSQALLIGTVPFILPGLIKVLLVGMLGRPLSRQLQVKLKN